MYKMMQEMPRTAQVSLSNGMPMKADPSVGVHQVSVSHRRSLLYILAESNGPQAEATCRRVQQIIEQYFSGSKLSVTSSLNNAIRAAHYELLDENRKSLPGHRVSARVCCGVLKGSDFYLGQAGSGLAYVLSKRGLRRMANQLKPEGESVDVLGREGELEVALYHHAAEEGDAILIASPQLHAYLSVEEIVSLMSGDREEAARKLHEVIPHHGHFATLLIYPSSGDLAGEGMLPVDSATIEDDVEPSEDGEDKLEKWRTLALVVLIGLSRRLRILRPIVERLQHLLIKGLSAAGGSVRELVPRVSENEPLGIGEPDIFAPPQRFPSLSGKHPSFRRSRRVPISVLASTVGLAVLVAFGIHLLTRPPEPPPDDSFVQMLRQAQENQERASAPSSRLAARQYLQNAEELVDRALQMKKGDLQALELKQEIASQLAVVNVAVPLTDLRPLVDFAGQEKGAESPSTAVVVGGNLYVLDKVNDKVTRHVLDANGALAPKTPQSVLWRRGEQWANMTLGKLADLVWVPAGGGRQSDAVLLFDEKRNLLEQSSGRGASPLVVRDADKWGSFDGAAGFNGSLYVLDRRGNQVWRYDPTQNGFDSERRPMLEVADLREAVDIAVDGSIYLLMSDGHIARFAGGLQVPFNQEDIDKPLQGPTVIFTGAATKSVYVGDPGNQRIVVFSKDGRFQRQFVSEHLDNVRGIFVDEEKHLLYAVSGKKVYLATLPAETAVKKTSATPTAKQ